METLLNVAAANHEGEKCDAFSRPRRRSVSASAKIYQSLRADIVAMRLRPGSALLEKQIAASFGVSRTPVREAVLKLAGEGLVDIFPQSGTFVSRIPLGALPEVLVIRSALEQAAARYAAARALPAQVEALRANIARQKLVPAEDHEAFHTLDEAFHGMVAEVAGYPGIWALTKQVKVQIDRCRRLIMPQPGRRAEAIEEHQSLVDAIAARDGQAAARAVALHMERVLNLIDRARAATPEYFVGPTAA